MRLTSRLCKALNSFFPLPVHPFNLQNQGKQTYAEWQYEKGADTLEFFLQHASLKEILAGRQVLDIGCGAGGKTLFYAAQGAAMVYGVDVVERYAAAAHELARAKGLQDRFRFVLADAAALPFGPDSFDVIIMNDAMEHVDKPLAVLQECYRVLRPGGRLYVNFPPYYHPFGAHLSDAMGFPWVQLFFSDRTLIEVYKDLVKDLPDGKERIDFRISRSKSGGEYFSYINKMTIKRFQKLLPRTEFKLVYYREVPLRSFFKPLASLPVLKEAFVKMTVAILEK